MSVPEALDMDTVSPASTRHSAVLAMTDLCHQCKLSYVSGQPMFLERNTTFFSTQVIGHSNFGTIRSTTCVYKGERTPLRLRSLGRV
jgi:hypothetical protein